MRFARISDTAKAKKPGPSAPFLFSLPHGLDLGGVTSWAVRLANGLAARGRVAGMIVHPRREGHPAAQLEFHPGVIRIIPDGWPHMGEAQGNLAPYLATYRRAITDLSRAAYGPKGVGGGPVVLSPNILGDSYGIAAALCTTQADTVRVLAWQHADSEYDTAVLRRYEPIVSRFVAIDERYVGVLGMMFAGREEEIVSIPHGVEVPNVPPESRPPLAGRPLRLVYTGRIEHHQKRIGALALLSDELGRRGIDHRITIVGDGPAAAELDGLLAKRPKVMRVPIASAEEVTTFLDGADAFVLASRFEGLCISRIEAMARGCVPIITSANSGATTGLVDGQSAIFVAARPGDSEEAAAAHMADGIERFLASDRDAMAGAAWRAAGEHFGMDSHVDQVESVIDAAAAGPARWWRTDWPIAFSSSRTEPGRSGSTGPDAPELLGALLATLAGKRIVLHGAGQHTLELAGVIARSGAEIVAVTDDDKQRWGTRFLGWPVVAPQEAGKTGASELVISSYIHMRSIWERREVYESQGMRVHAVYAGVESGKSLDHALKTQRDSWHVKAKQGAVNLAASRTGL